MGLTKVYCANRDDWYERVTYILWAYLTTTKWLNMYIAFQLVYGREAIVPVEFLTPILFIAQATKMIDDDSLVELVEELVEIEEDRFLADFH